MAKEAYLVNSTDQVLEVGFGGNQYHLPPGETLVEEWDEVPPRLRPDVAQQAVRLYGEVKSDPEDNSRSLVSMQYREIPELELVEDNVS